MRNQSRDYFYIYTRAAKKLGLKYKIISSQIYNIYNNNKSIRFFVATPDVNNSTSHVLTDRKHQTNIFLKKYNLPVFKQKAFYKKPNSELIKFADKIGYPIIIKPVDGYGGEGIITDIQNKNQLKTAVKEIKKNYNLVLIEKFYIGFDFRILICHKKVLAVTKRFPAMVIGNGNDNIKKLIDTKNKKSPYKITVGLEVLHKLKKQNMTIKSIPEKNQEIYLRNRSNAHLGGTTYNLDIKKVHPDYIKACLKAMKELDLVFAGFDFMTTDITKSYKKTGGAITEVNDNPGIYMQSRSAENPIDDIAEQVLINLFEIKNRTKTRSSK